jgi:hypothetical protein
MDTFLEIIKYLIPSLIVLATAWLLLRTFMQAWDKKDTAGDRTELLRISGPIRMQAYERLILLLERIQPSSLILRINLPGKTASELQAILLQEIRNEVDHNLSQQLYVSSEAWDKVKSTREDLIRLINTAVGKLPADAVSVDLAQQILVLSMETNLMGEQAIEYLKQEARKEFF